ncbi:MAG TPA: DNA cytosine methyltransferase [Dehalococcoidia bacterium]|nr:DNA cytosine methyltransferase [Dehalococcoidia bacterium]
MDTPSRLSEENRARIAYLFDNGAFDLPNEVRPACHRNGHTYPSVYGRLRWNEPAGTITTGFVSPGRGRFIHPSEPRTLTPHEAARLQTFPDFFRFVLSDNNPPTRAQVTKWIGGAVPPLLGYAAAMTILPMWPQTTADTTA